MDAELTFENIKPSIPHDARVIAIAGTPDTGKTTMAKSFVGWEVIHVDNYLEWFSREERARGLIALCNRTTGRYIIEGCEVGRMLRTGDREGTWHPDFIIWRQPDKKLNGWPKGLQTIFADYMQERTVQVPVFYAP